MIVRKTRAKETKRILVEDENCAPSGARFGFFIILSLFRNHLAVIRVTSSRANSSTPAPSDSFRRGSRLVFDLKFVDNLLHRGHLLRQLLSRGTLRLGGYVAFQSAHPVCHVVLHVS